MPAKDNFFEISPRDRKAQVHFRHFDRIMEADDPEIFHLRVKKWESALKDGISPDRRRDLDAIHAKAVGKENSYAVGCAILEVLVEVMNDMGFSEGEITYTLDPRKEESA